ncbi:MAG: ABC transporter ATP-binding protein [Gammaproteobacteria bacterium]
MSSGDESVLAIEDLSVSFTSDEGEHQVLDRVSISLGKNRILGVAGESGCGKSVMALSILRLLPQPAGRIVSGRVLFDGMDLCRAEPEELYRIRGKRISMIFQEPMMALNPVQKIGRQIAEVYELHFPELSPAQVRDAVIEILAQVGIPSAQTRIDEYPHQLSGGMRQRVMIAMALAPRPDILIADEPTTALDVTIQGQILALLRQLQAEYGMSVIFITHDLGVIANLCDEVIIMYAGRVVEQAPTADLFNAPSHPYTRGLLASTPRLDGTPKTRLNAIEGIVPAPAHFPPGCRFQDRCDARQQDCEAINPELQAVNAQHRVACLHWRD